MPLTAAESELLDALEGMVRQHSTVENTAYEVERWRLVNEADFDSGSLTADAEAIRLLVKYGRARLTFDCGRRCIGNWVEKP